MRLLLDTHIWIWAADNPRKLGRRTTRQLQSRVNEIYLSAVSIWEFIMLAEKGRFPRVRDPLTWIEPALARWPLHEVGLSREIAQEAARISLPHGDPADRLLVATARVHACRFVTADAKIIDSGLVDTLVDD